jgi:hypothetical protein
VVIFMEGSTRMWDGNEHRSSTGVKEQGMWTEGPPGTWEALSSPPTIRPDKGKPVEQSPGLMWGSLAPHEERNEQVRGGI